MSLVRGFCLWGATNAYVDCAGESSPFRGFYFCEIHADCLDSMDDEEGSYKIRSLRDTVVVDHYS